MENQTRERSEGERSEEKRKLMNERRGSWKEKEEAGLEMEFSLEAGMRQWVPLKNKLAVGNHHRHDYRKTTRGLSGVCQTLSSRLSVLLFPSPRWTASATLANIHYKTPTGQMSCCWWTFDYNELFILLFLIPDRQGGCNIITIGSC